eukprot:1842035-Alexandrium_andersonii.AAC.1
MEMLPQVQCNPQSAPFVSVVQVRLAPQSAQLKMRDFFRRSEHELRSLKTGPPKLPKSAPCSIVRAGSECAG